MADTVSRRWRLGARTVSAACGMLALANVAIAQGGRVLVIGRTLDDQGVPVSHVHITLAGTFVETQSDARGLFRVELLPGDWTFRGRLLGYRPDSIAASIRAGMSDTVRMTLRHSLNELHEITTTADAAPAMSVSASAENVRQLPALGEPDLLRVLPFLPGVHQTDDMRAALYLAGSASDEVAMRLDGFRLQWPTHLNGIFGALDVSALDRADVMIHHLPASVDGAVGGVIDFWPRIPGPKPTVDASLSLLSASATTTAETPGENLQVLATARATYAEKAVSQIIGRSRATQTDALPSSFHDWLARVSTRPRGAFSASVIGYGTDDERPRTSSSGRPLSWGEGLVGVHTAWTTRRWIVEGQASTDDASLEFREPNGSDRGIDLDHRWNTATIQLRHNGDANRTSLGVSGDWRQHADHWNSSAARGTVAPLVPFHYDSTTSQQVAAAFVESQFQNALGTLIIGGRASQLAGQSYFAPRLLLSHSLSPAWTVTSTIERRHQFDAQLSPLGDQAVTQPVFLLDRARAADAAALSGAWHSPNSAGDDGIRVEVTAYGRRYPNRAVLRTPSVADTIDLAFPAFQRVVGRARGLSIGGVLTSTRHVVMQASYTYQYAESRSVTGWIPADWDIRHALAMFGSVPLLAGWTLTASGQVRSGFPITPVDLRVLVPQLGSDSYSARFAYGPTNSARIPGFRRMDVGVHHAWHALAAEWTFSAQVVNVLARNNPMSYDWRVYFDEVGSTGSPLTSHSGLPVVPSIGLAVRW